MEEKEFLQDLFDLMCGNTNYITLEQFREKYDGYIVEMDCEANRIRMMDDHNEWHLNLQKVWCDATQV